MLMKGCCVESRQKATDKMEINPALAGYYDKSPGEWEPTVQYIREEDQWNVSNWNSIEDTKTQNVSLFFFLLSLKQMRCQTVAMGPSKKHSDYLSLSLWEGI